MRSLQQQIIAEMGVKPKIDAAQEVEDRVQFLVDYALVAHARGYVLGISGGVDSSLAGRLAQLAVERLRAEHNTDATFTAVRLPFEVQADEADAQAAMDFIQPDDPHTVDIAPGVVGLEEQIKATTGAPLTDFNRGNLKARMRMAAQYALAGERGQLVVGTDQAAESTMGFFTKFGDGGADVLPLAGLTKGQVGELLRHLGAPQRVVGKAPTADLLDGQPGRLDEDEMGVSYAHLDAYLRGETVPGQAAERIEAAYLRSRHKRRTPTTPSDTWWKE
ncbi:ammonia-dependent NAD(+) synthetase [Pseudoglutamicibacter albus]|uniref:ammonia-dependent NAD(+) synthetase n=1 Tax=Pseudoglutamicibacter albus TaxID=98671 RepID=UPI001EF6B33F|nr:ammonia-dependent NAD(+) synthetase [Pseudoglutamicibacter albus]MCG7303729.1 ammonia-dependent NAD(+) synthetase [Pseudoglutamicibacter albus]